MTTGTDAPGAALVREWLRMMTEGDMDHFGELFTDDAVVTQVFAPKDYPGELRGRESIARHFRRAATEVHSMVGFTEPAFDDCSADVTWARFEGRMIVAASGRRYDNSYVFRVEVADGRIARIDTYYDATVLLEAFAGDVGAARVAYGRD